MCWLKGVKVITLVSVVMTVAHLQVLSAGERYKFAIIAATGQPIGDELLAGIENNVSMNGNGKVAFVGTVGNRYYVCIGDGVDRFFTITSNFSLQSNRRFDAAVQINDNDQVVATDRVVTTPILTFVRIWDGRALDSDRLIARGGPGYPYDT